MCDCMAWQTPTRKDKAELLAERQHILSGHDPFPEAGQGAAARNIPADLRHLGAELSDLFGARKTSGGRRHRHLTRPLGHLTNTCSTHGR